MKDTQTAIRKYHTDDTDALVSVWQEANALVHSFLADEFVSQVEKDMRNIYLPNAETWVLVKGEQPVGFVALIEDEIGGLFLHPSLHGQGLGKALVAHAVTLKGPLRVEVFERNTIGRRFYEGYGFMFAEKYLHEPSGEMTLKMVMPPS